MATLVVIRREGDWTEGAMSSNWANPFVSTAGSFPLIASLNDLDDGNATREAVDLALQPQSWVLYFGHGTPAQLGDPALIDDRNIGRAVGGIVVAFACSSAARLGGAAVRRFGVAAYVGFHGELPVYAVPASIVAGGILDALQHLAGGATIGATFDSLMKSLDDVMKAHHPSRPDHTLNDGLIYLYAWGMSQSARLFGHHNARLTAG